MRLTISSLALCVHRPLFLILLTSPLTIVWSVISYVKQNEVVEAQPSSISRIVWGVLVLAKPLPQHRSLQGCPRSTYVQISDILVRAVLPLHVQRQQQRHHEADGAEINRRDSEGQRK
eukprot:5949131-Amphidinium_carterae.1